MGDNQFWGQTSPLERAMSVILKLISTAASIPTEFDGRYLRTYHPTVRLPDGGISRDHTRGSAREMA